MTTTPNDHKKTSNILMLEIVATVTTVYHKLVLPDGVPTDYHRALICSINLQEY